MPSTDAVADLSVGKARYVTACQQLLALAVVGAVLVPATGVVSLDVVHEPRPGYLTDQDRPADEGGVTPGR